MIRWVLLSALVLVVIAIVLSLSLTLGRNRNENPLVETKLGTIRGLHEEDGDYSMFLGIPYANVNESNPFGAATPHPEFTETFNAFDDTAICPQREEFNHTITGTLDCLHLNIYVPNTPTSKPVLVWIYGGEFKVGFAGRFLYGPKFFMKQDVILVTLNYRLGPYGFMCLDTPEVPGNQGLKDQLIALKWVKENIAAFNGDVSRITILGESAGAMSTESHLLSDHEKYYSQAIIQSGSVFIPSLYKLANLNIPLKIAEKLGFITSSISEAMSFLSQSDSDAVIKAYLDSKVELSLCVEKEFEGVDRFITKHPEFSDVAKVKNMPILAGFNGYELMSFFVNIPSEQFPYLANIFREFLSHNFDVDNEFDAMLDVVRRFYIGDEVVSDAVRWDIIDFGSDVYFNYPGQKSIMKFVENGANVYQYLFSYSGGRNFYKRLLNISADGASHADELGYLFDMAFIPEVPSADDQLIIDRITTLWANFAKYGNPTPEVTELLPVKWPAVTADRVNYVTIDSEMSVRTRPFNQRLAFWDLFFTANHDKLMVHEMFNTK